MWEDSILSPPPPVSEIRNALGTALKKKRSIHMLCSNRKDVKNMRKIIVEVKISANDRGHRWLNAT